MPGKSGPGQHRAQHGSDQCQEHIVGCHHAGVTWASGFVSHLVVKDMQETLLRKRWSGVHEFELLFQLFYDWLGHLGGWVCVSLLHRQSSLTRFAIAVDAKEVK